MFRAKADKADKTTTSNTSLDLDLEKKDNDFNTQNPLIYGRPVGRRIGPPIVSLAKVSNNDVAKDSNDDLANGSVASSNDLSIEKQIAMEADNAIKYRTCSWQKVCFRIRRVCVKTTLIDTSDCSPAVLRVHLPGHHVIPVVLLHPRSCARFDLDGRCR